jgi:enediyne biosynthesis protein E4
MYMLSRRKWRKAWLWAATALASGPSCLAQTDFKAEIALVPAASSGIDFIHTDGASGRRYIVETVLGSLALFDFDGDGLIDIYFINGAALPGTEFATPPTNRLYKNLGGWKFVDVTEASGLGDARYGMGVVVGDVDQDGDPDLFLSNFGQDVLYINQGDGTFVDATAASGIRLEPRFGAGNVLFDMDLDGDLDLYCASYVEFDPSRNKTRTIAGYAFHTGPNDYEPARDRLYRNNGDGTFTDVSEASGIASLKAPGMGVLSADFDEDGDMDLFVANDQKGNFLLLNDGSGRFQDEAVLAGVAFDRNGRANGNMGVEYADINRDGWLDLLTTTYQEEMPVYYAALGGGLFTDSTNLARIDPTLTAHVNWGIGAIDFDNDGELELFIACGHFLDNLRFIDDRTSVKVVNYLLAKAGQGRFRNVTAVAGSALQVVESSRGAAFDDLDNDGTVDLVVLNVNAAPTIGRTQVLADHRSLSLRLVGTQSNRDGVGSLVSVTPAGARAPQKQVVLAGRGYESAYGSRLYFGLGTATTAKVTVAWPSGLKEEFLCEAGAVTVVEGRGQFR